MLDILLETPGDTPEIETLLDLSFGPDRLKKRSYHYRRGVPPIRELCLVARDPGRSEIVGGIRYWPVTIGQMATPALLLGPLAIKPERRGTGVGAALMRQSLARAEAMGHRVVVLVGDLAYYGRFGFSPAQPRGIFMSQEVPERVLAAELQPGALDGVVGAIHRWRPKQRSKAA
ncbi:MAG: N-acetyltransferase [Alphaproteobacteria bacterium]|nr:MAG: N-acetyltransferase [Alphaproteobacteria bacterium]